MMALKLMNITVKTLADATALKLKFHDRSRPDSRRTPRYFEGDRA